MNDFSQLITIRRSHRKFTEQSISEEQLKAILRAGLIAPSSKGLHSSDFVVVRDKRTIARLSTCKSKGSDFLIGAPLVICVTGDPIVSDVWEEDGSVAAAFMLLQAEDLGLGACWVQIRNRQDAEGRASEDDVRRLLSIPTEKQILCMIAVGYKGMERKPQNEERLKLENIHYEQWS